jgi:SRSO17 transposase
MNRQSADKRAAVAQAQGRANELHSLTDYIGPRFPRSGPRQHVLAYMRGLISPVERKNSWQLAEQAGDASPYGMQHLLGRARWSADSVRDDLLDFAIERLAGPHAVLILDETGFLKKGQKSAGVARQYSGTAGRIENCQVGVFLVYASSKGRTFLDRELYLPKAWTDDAARCKAATTPEDVKFATKLQSGRRMLQRAFAAGVEANWVTGDSVYGNDSQMRSWLDQLRQAYVLGVTAQLRLWTDGQRQWALEVISSWPKSKWQQLSCGAGSKGERLYEWGHIVIGKGDDGWQRWLLARRSLRDPDEVS